MLRRLAICVALLIGTSPAQSIPLVHTQSLAGNTVDLPNDLHGRPALLVLGFSRGSQDDVTAWSKRLTADLPAVPYYELAMLASVPRLIRGFVTRSIKSSVPERAQPHFLPLTTDEAAWRALAHDNGGDNASILLIDGKGTLLWRTHGPLTEAAFQDLKHHLP